MVRIYSNASEDADEQQRALFALAHASNISLVDRALQMSISGEVPQCHDTHVYAHTYTNVCAHV